MVLLFFTSFIKSVLFYTYFMYKHIQTKMLDHDFFSQIFNILYNFFRIKNKTVYLTVLNLLLLLKHIKIVKSFQKFQIACQSI
jgi:hypothetical protein